MRSFKEFAQLDYSPVVQLIDKYMEELKKKEKKIAEPLYYFSKPKVTRREEFFTDFWEALNEMKNNVERHINNGNLYSIMGEIYKRWRKHFETQGRDEDYANMVDEWRADTKLFTIFEMVEDITKGRQIEV